MISTHRFIPKSFSTLQQSPSIIAIPIERESKLKKVLSKPQTKNESYAAIENRNKQVNIAAKKGSINT